jgi:hypothetical protein
MGKKIRICNVISRLVESKKNLEEAGSQMAKRRAESQIANLTHDH